MSGSIRLLGAMAALGLVTAAAVPRSSAVPRYHIVKQVKVVDSGATDFLTLDARTRRLFGAGYKVLDIDSYQVLGELPSKSGYSFALAPELGKGIGRSGVI